MCMPPPFTVCVSVAVSFFIFLFLIVNNAKMILLPGVGNNRSVFYLVLKRGVGPVSLHAYHRRLLSVFLLLLAFSFLVVFDC